MKLIYSHLQTFLPDLTVTPQKLRDDLTMIGHFCNFYEEIDGEIVFDLDIKVNRGDCLGYYGLAKDLSIYYDLKLSHFTDYELRFTDYQLPITITSPDVLRVMCLQLSQIKVGESPDWLSKFVRIHGVNSVNNVVDLTNYIMFLYGIPNHAFDTAKTGKNLIWENNHGKTSNFTTLDGTVFNLSAENLVISNPQEVVSTDFVGGKNSGTYDSTQEIIIEVAIYNPVRIRIDSREHKTVTEAGIRLEKNLDCNLIPQAIKHLAVLITDLTGAKISSDLFDYYLAPVIPPQIAFDPQLPSIISGINIPTEFALDIVAKVSHRPDLNIAEDLAEEVIRFYGYNNIPTTEPLHFKEVKNITPKIINLIEQIKDQMVSEGYDEVLTWPLVSTASDPKTAIKTENGINTEVVYLRQNMITSLKLQLEQYQKYKLPHPKFFEIGKIYYQENGNYVEKYALGKYDGQNFSETILDDLDKPDTYLPKAINNHAIELTSQIVTLDANVTSIESPEKIISHYQSLIPDNILWSIEITDHYQDKYTFRVCYFNCDDKTAKKIHLRTFGLDKINL